LEPNLLLTTHTEEGCTLENGGDDYLDSSEGGAAQYLRQAYVSDEHGEMNLATSSRRSSRYPSMGGGEIDQIIQKQNRNPPQVQIMMTSESSEEEEEQRPQKRR
jgi:hypothetical protein